MKYIPGTFAAVVFPILLVTGACSAPQAEPQKTPEQVQQDTHDWVFRETGSACDQYGHRVYKFQSNKEGGLAVVPNDPTCKENK